MLSILLNLFEHVSFNGIEDGYVIPVLDKGRWTWPALKEIQTKKGRGLAAAVDLPAYTKIPYLGKVIDMRDQEDQVLFRVFKQKIPVVETFDEKKQKSRRRPANELELHILLEQAITDAMMILDKKRAETLFTRRAGQIIEAYYSPENTLAIAGLSNEPSIGEEINMVSWDGWLVTIKDVKANEELLWCYGTGYERDYKVNCPEKIPEIPPEHEPSIAIWQFLREYNIEEETISTIEELLKWFETETPPLPKKDLVLEEADERNDTDILVKTDKKLRVNDKKREPVVLVFSLV